MVTKPARCWWNRAIRAIRGRGLVLWYHPAYRLPMTSIEARAGIDPRRADLAAWYLVEWGLLPSRAMQASPRVPYADLARVHDPAYLESLQQPEVLARIFGVDPWDVQVGELLDCIRRACGATVAAARQALGQGGTHLNLLGGFHHAYPDKGGGLCVLNDLAVAVACLRAEGFDGQVVVLDLDAHPPDGTAACLAEDPACWIGSISGADWCQLPGVDEVVLQPGTGDEAYLEALDALLTRMPKPDIALVIAGGDVLEGDRLGRLALSMAGARDRDLRVLEALDGVPSVWVPGGGYHRHHGWRVLAGTAMALETGSRTAIPGDLDPMRHHYGLIAKGLGPEHLGAPTASDDDPLFTAEDIEEALGMRRVPKAKLLLDFYSEEGLEYALSAYGFLPHLRRLGYGDFGVEIDGATAGERMRVLGVAEGRKWLLVETVLEKQLIDGQALLFVNWLSLRNPRASFSDTRPQLPGQEVPGLGMAREAGQMLARMARRLDLAGVAFRPAWFHVAYTARYHFCFLDPRIQGWFEALLRDLAEHPLLTVTQAVADGRILLHGEPFTWEPGVMAYRFEAPERFDERVAEARDAAVFTLVQPEG